MIIGSPLCIPYIIIKYNAIINVNRDIDRLQHAVIQVVNNIFIFFTFQ